MTPIVELVYSIAPDITDKSIANPVGEIWSGAMMIDYLGKKKATENILQSIESI